MKSVMRARYFVVRIRLKLLVITWRVPRMSCRHLARLDLRHRSVFMTFRNVLRWWRCRRGGARALAAVTDTLAQTEGLFAHAKAAALRGGANEDVPISAANKGKGKTE